MLIYFARHGITAHNQDDAFQTATTSLSLEGQTQAAELANRLRQSGIKRIYCSTMTRAVETANIVARELSVPVIQTPLLEEIKRPSAVRGKSKRHADVVSIMKEVKAHFADPVWKHSDEENYYQLAGRSRDAVQLLLASPDSEILVVSHGEILRMILTLLVFGDAASPELFARVNSTFGTSNAGLTIVTKDQRGWYIRTWNEESHLPSIKYEYAKDKLLEPLSEM